MTAAEVGLVARKLFALSREGDKKGDAAILGRARGEGIGKARKEKSLFGSGISIVDEARVVEQVASKPRLSALGQ